MVKQSGLLVHFKNPVSKSLHHSQMSELLTCLIGCHAGQHRKMDFNGPCQIKSGCVTFD